MLWGALLLTVVARAQLLRLDLGGSLLTLLALLSSSTQRGQRVLLLLLLLLLGHPGMGPNTGCLADRGAVNAVTAVVASLCYSRHPCMTVGWQVLVELIDIKAAHVGNDLTAQLANVHSPKVDV